MKDSTTTNISIWLQYYINALTIIFCEDFFEIDFIQTINILQPNLMFADKDFVFFFRLNFMFTAAFAAASAPVWHSVVAAIKELF